MQIIKGHTVQAFKGVNDCWVVDGRFTYYDIRTLANVLGMSVSELEEVLYV